MAKGEKELFERLNELGIEHETLSHEPVFTVEESQALRDNLPGGHTKNLFLRDKKKNLWLATIEENQPVNLKQLKKVLGASGNLSFGNADLLMEVLGVIPGAVTAFSVINDTEKRITMVLDKALLDQELVNGHPLRNDKTTAVKSSDLLTFLQAEGYDPLILDFELLAKEAEEAA
ncbi:MAG: YbaK/EbsC family protein [Alphaproteobacteria bacterium]|nr:YbaK/EbsC family protein [Alphaproteobacteria bacterium]